jgi:2-oxoglutarate-Fe(II)-dependent oxygenase superfamily protein
MTEFPDPSIMVKHDAFDPSGLIEEIEKHREPWRPGTYGADTKVREGMRKCTMFPISLLGTIPEVATFDKKLFAVFGAAIKEYQYHFPFLNAIIDEGYVALKYEPGGFIKLHADKSGDGSRIVSGTLYLNNDFKEGNLVFPKQKVTIRPEKGMLVLFPCSFAYPHEVTEVTEGIRYCIVTWFKGEVLDAVQ